MIGQFTLSKPLLSSAVETPSAWGFFEGASTSLDMSGNEAGGQLA
jgi:hypothetical protein